MSPVSLDALRRGQVVEAPRPGSHLARVLRLLRRRPDQAFRAAEVAAALQADAHTIGAALRRLRSRGLVGKKGPYWFALGQAEAALLGAAKASTRDLNARHGPEDPAAWRTVPHK